MAERARKTLHLLSGVDSLPGRRCFTVGEDDCTRIEARPTGAGGYEIHVGPRLLVIPEHKVDHLEQEPRPGYDQEQANAGRALPSYVQDVGDGTYGCKTCGRINFKTVHAVKVHFGTQHGGDRDA